MRITYTNELIKGAGLTAKINLKTSRGVLWRGPKVIFLTASRRKNVHFEILEFKIDSFSHCKI